MYTAPMAVLVMPQRSYCSWLRKTVTVWWTSVSRPEATSSAASPGAAREARSVALKGSRAARSAGAGRTSVNPRESSAAAP